MTVNRKKHRLKQKKMNRRAEKKSVLCHLGRDKRGLIVLSRHRVERLIHSDCFLFFGNLVILLGRTSEWKNSFEIFHLSC